MEARTLPPKRGAELLRAEARRLRIAQQLRRGRELSEVAEKLGLSGTLVTSVWIELVKELRRTEQAGGQAQLLDEKQQALAADRAKLQAIADRFHAGWRLASVARDVGLTRRLVVFGLSINLGRLRRRTRQAPIVRNPILFTRSPSIVKLPRGTARSVPDRISTRRPWITH